MRPAALAILLPLMACAGVADAPAPDRVYAPETDPGGETVDGYLVGHRLMDAGEPELALEAFQRAAFDRGLDADMLSAIGSANLALGRLNQAEDLLRRAVAVDGAEPAAWNNLGVVLIERGQSAEAAEMFRRAYALDNGESDAIRDNLRLALAKRDNPEYAAATAEPYRILRRGLRDFVIETAR
jgi:Flp pilus assembly protein TadD